jgi:hypothetical protein
MAISIDAALTRADPPEQAEQAEQAEQWGATLPSLSRDLPH